MLPGPAGPHPRARRDLPGADPQPGRTGVTHRLPGRDGTAGGPGRGGGDPGLHRDHVAGRPVRQHRAAGRLHPHPRRDRRRTRVGLAATGTAA